MSASVKRLDCIFFSRLCVSVCIFQPVRSICGTIFIPVPTAEIHIKYASRSDLASEFPLDPKISFLKNVFRWMSTTLASLYPTCCEISMVYCPWPLEVVVCGVSHTVQDDVRPGFSPFGPRHQLKQRFLLVQRIFPQEEIHWHGCPLNFYFFFHSMSVPQWCAYKPITPFFINFCVILPDAILYLVWKRLSVHSLVLSVVMTFPPSRSPSLSWHLLSSCYPLYSVHLPFCLSLHLSYLVSSLYSSSFLFIITSYSLVFALSFILTSQSSLPLSRSLSHVTWQNHWIFKKKRESVVCHCYWSLQTQDFFLWDKFNIFHFISGSHHLVIKSKFIDG